eukprot:TRINITY_DN12904_c0_g1_i1.p1 TRINITY_DN12904_c0_g1~~TRINITY_DN12904_c0_g1_i1.p1  ORF type:complete len:140 (+),score=30.85 TRINITY_DN12904_c0_g1_i1:110-529(+)
MLEQPEQSSRNQDAEPDRMEVGGAKEQEAAQLDNGKSRAHARRSSRSRSAARQDCAQDDSSACHEADDGKPLRSRRRHRRLREVSRCPSPHRCRSAEYSLRRRTMAAAIAVAAGFMPSPEDSHPGEGPDKDDMPEQMRC